MKAVGRFWNVLKWPLAAALLWFLFYQHRSDVEHVLAARKRWDLLGLALVLCTASTLVTFFRWYLLVRAQQFPFRVRDALRLGFLGLVMNYVSPGAVGGDLFKAVLLAREQTSRRAVAVATVVLDRILGLLALFIVGAAATLFPQVPHNPALELATVIIWVGTLCGLAGLVLMLVPGVTSSRLVQGAAHWPYVGHILGDLLHGVRLYQSRRGVVCGAVLLSLVGHAGLITCFYFCAASLQQPWVPSLGLHLYLMPIAETVGVAIPLPGGVGALERAVQWFYEQLAPPNISADAALAAGLVATITFRVVTLATAALGVGYYLTSRREVAAALQEAEHLPAPSDEVPDGADTTSEGKSSTGHSRASRNEAALEVASR